jgi:hypothetical protein
MLPRILAFSLLISFCFSIHAASLEKKIVCTWDPVGNNGPVIAFFSDLTPKAQTWGLDLSFIAYEDENQVTADLKAILLISSIVSPE